MKTSYALLATAALGAALGLAIAEGRHTGSTAAPPPEPAPPPTVAPRLNVILILVDTLRAGHMGVYGYPRDTTPRLDAFARRSLVFRRAYTQAPWTIPAIASLFTSQYGDVHQVDAPPEADEHNRLGGGFVTLAEALRSEGYRTAAITSQPWLRSDLGFAQGFDVYDVVTNLFDEDEGAHLLERVWQWLVANGRDERPFFLYVHTMGPHAPYHTPPPFDGMFATEDPSPEVAALHEGMRSPASFMRSYQTLVSMAEKGALDERDLAFLAARYDEKLAQSDRVLGRFLDNLEASGLLEESLLVLTADHGEAFGEHGNLFHSQTLYPEDIHVPLILHDPRNGRRGRTDDSIAELIDVYPTILGALGYPVPASLNGRSLVGPHREGGPEVARAVGATGVRIVTREWSGLFAHGASDPLHVFDLRVDPGEHRPLGPAEAPEGHRVVRAAMARTADEIAAREGAGAPETGRIDEDLRRQLESLGYLR